MTKHKLHVGLHTQDPAGDAAVVPAAGYARVGLHVTAPREQAILSLLIEGMRNEVSDAEMCAYVEAELVRRGMKP